MAKKTLTKARTENLETQVRQWFAEGYTEAEIFETLVKTRPKADPRAIIDSALDTFAQSGQADASIVKGWALEAIAFCYRKLVETGDYPAAIRAASKLVEIAEK